MIPIAFPNHPFRIKQEGNKDFIFDEVRKKWLMLTPEEWVRQNFVQYLMQVKQYPAALLSIEKEIKLGELKKRCDVVVYKNETPWMIVECKEMNVSLSQDVLEQIIQYNLQLKVHYLLITNGKFTFCYDTKLGNWLHELPQYNA
jgi:hypothetical protein